MTSRRYCVTVITATTKPKWITICICFCNRSPHFDAAEFTALKRAFDLTAIQRQIKALGIFARLHLRDGKSSHLVWIEPVLRGLIEVTSHYSETKTSAIC